MTAAHPVACVVVAAGSGSRLGAGVPKALVPLAGRPLLAHAIEGVAAAVDADGSPAVDVLVVVGPPDRLAQVDEVVAASWPVRRPAIVRAGGADRVASVRAGLTALPASTAVVLVHDAARCLMPAAMFAAVVAAVRSGHDAVVPGMAVVDTVKLVDVGDGPPWRVRSTPARVSLRAVQTPQGFRRQVLDAAHRTADGANGAGAPVEVTDDAGLVEAAGGEVSVIPGHADGLKITTAEDLRVAEWALLARAARAAPAAGVPVSVVSG